MTGLLIVATYLTLVAAAAVAIHLDRAAQIRRIHHRYDQDIALIEATAEQSAADLALIWDLWNHTLDREQGWTP